MEEKDKFLGCLVSGPALYHDADKLVKEQSLQQGKLFRNYIWGNKGISSVLSRFRNEDYGKDLRIILFQFYINPLPVELHNLPEIEQYRAKERSIGIPVVVTEENFFCKPEKERYHFINHAILQKLDLLAQIVKKRGWILRLVSLNWI